MSPRVTIAIPTYNRAATFLPEALASACGQTYPDLDIFVCDNASVDGTRELVGSLGDARIRYYRQESNVGPFNNMNFCVQQAQGDYLVVLPDDDLMDRDFVECCIDLLADRREIGMVRAGTRVVDGAGQVLREIPNRAVGLSFDDFVVAWLSGETSPYQCSTLFQTQALQRVGLQSRHYLFDDVIAQFRIAARWGRLDLEAVKGTFRLHAGELTSKADITAWCEESLDLIEILCQLAPAKAELIRARGAEFLVMGNYRRAWRHPWPRRLLDCVKVFRAHDFALPPARIWTHALERRVRKVRTTIGLG